MLDFSGTVWRILFKAWADQPLAPARAPEGRFHHSGQIALYASLKPEGAGIAIHRYVSPNDQDRVIQPLAIRNAKLVDLRGRSDASVVWQDLRQHGEHSPTWAFSDHARDLGAQGMLYSSRSRPDLTHCVLFDLHPKVLRIAGPSQGWQSGL